MHDSAPRPDSPLRVLVVDADDRVRESLTGILGIGRDVVVVGSAGLAGPALDLVASADPDVVIVDPRLPEVEGGIAFMTRLRVAAPGVRVLVLSWSDDFEHAGLARRSDGFIRKTFRPGELAAAIVAAGRRPVRPTDGRVVL